MAIALFPSTGFSQTVFTEDWESGIGTWYADNGVWEVGIPSVGPDSTHSGVNCAGTILDGNYPSYANTRLISPSIILPSLQPGEEIRLYFWQWFRIDEPNFYGPDKGYVQISVNGGNWQSISGTISGYSPVWTQMSVDLSAYADSTVRIGFYFTSTREAQNYGWYIDDISVQKGIFTFSNPEDFELGIGNWNTDNGLWEVGIPTLGPSATHSGQNCAATVLGGNYQPYANTRLISPKIMLNTIPGQLPLLCFWQWFRINENNFYGPDNGYIQISVNGGNWQTIAGPFSGISTVWSQFCIDLSTYIDSTISIGFYFTSTREAEDNGWYLDDIRIEGIVAEIEENQNTIPSEYMVSQNYPNPFNPSTKIKYHLPDAGFITIGIYDVLGNEIATIVNEEKPAGSYEINFSAKGGANYLSSGIYFYKLQAGSFVETKKMILMK